MSADSLIPARLIQTGKQRDFSLRQCAFVRNLQLLNPDYQWCFFTDADVERFIDDEFPQYRPAFDAFTYPIQRYDFFRYLAVYRLGGFYFDLDVLLAAPLESLRPLGCVFPFEGLTLSQLLRDYGMDWEIGNYGFGATPGHPLLKAVIENCLRAQADPVWVQSMMRGVPLLSRAEHQVLYTTGPGLLSRTLAEHPTTASTVTVLFPEDVCDMRTWHHFGKFGVHLMDGAWRPRTGFVRRRLTQRWEALAVQRAVRRSRLIGRTRSIPRLAGA